MTMYIGGQQGPVPPDQVRELPTEGLALVLLAQLATTPEQVNLGNLMNQADQGYAGERDRKQLKDRISDAVAWIESRGLVGRVGNQGGWGRLTKLGREIAADGAALAKLFAAERLAGKLDNALEAKVRLPINSGDYETACFTAMKEVEVAVREAGRFRDSLIGVALMKQAFSRDDGPLTDMETEPGERVAMMELFAGAIGAFKNPSSHRAVDFADPVEAVEIVQLADLLLRIVRRAEARNARPSADRPQ
jgi:uncharacterized protein (TIGR02391 family)